MVSSVKGGNPEPWTEGSRSIDGFEKSLENTFSSMSMSTLSAIGNRPPELSGSSLLTHEEYSGYKTGELLGDTSGLSPLSPASDTSRNNNNGTINLPYASRNTEYEDDNRIVNTPLLKMSHASLNQYFPAPPRSHLSSHQIGTQLRGTRNGFSVEGGGRDNTDVLLNKATMESSTINKVCQNEVNTLDQLHEKQNEFQNESLFCDNKHLSGFSHESIGRRIFSANNHLENSQSHMQDVGKYDLGATALNASNKEMRPIDSDVIGHRLGSGYDTSTNHFGDDGRKTSTIRPNYSPLHSMGSVVEHEAFLGNRVRASSLGYPLNTGSSVDNHYSQPRTVFSREVAFDQDFQDKCSLVSSGGNADETYLTQQGCLTPAFNSLQGRSSSDEMCTQKFNGLEYQARCTPSQSLSTAENHQLAPNHCSSPDQNYRGLQHSIMDTFQQASPSRQRVMSADGIYNKYHSDFQEQGQAYNSFASDSDSLAVHSKNFDGANYNFDVQQTNRPRSYSSGTNASEYVRSQRLRMHSSQFVSGFNENIHLPQRPDGSTVHQSCDKNFFAQNTGIHGPRQQNQGHDYSNVGGVLESNMRQSLNPRFPSASIGVNEHSVGCNYISGRLGYSCPQLVEISHRGSNMALFDDNTILVRKSSGSGTHMSTRNSSKNAVHPKSRKEDPVNVSLQHFTSADSLAHYQGKKGLLKTRPKFVYNIKFKRNQRHFVLGQRMQRDVQVGSYVKVEADRGEDLGIVIGCFPSEKIMPGARMNCRNPDINNSTGNSSPDISLSSAGGSRDFKRVLRLATHDEILLLAVKKKEEDDLLQICKEKILQRGLPMNVVDAEYQFDRHKLTFFFEAEGRVDFRELVRDLFSIYKTRIWMQQLDKSIAGGDGSCPENVKTTTDVDALLENCVNEVVK